MTIISHRGDLLHVEDVAVPAIAEDVGTPFYCYSSAAMVERYRAYESALARLKVDIYYAVKANSNLAVIRTFADAGAGAEVVSIGEIRRAMTAGVPASRIVFAGVGKTREELAYALRIGILQVNIESEAELRALNEVALALGLVANAGLRINPNVDARTHAKITTGRKENKFGIDIANTPEMFTLAEVLPGVSLTSLSMHIGSQLTDLEPFRHAYMRMREMTLELRRLGHDVDHLDLGGGIGISYGIHEPPNLEAYAHIVSECVSDLDCCLSVEPGRSLVGDAGILVTRVIYIKRGAEKRFVIADAAMNDLLRPTLYEATHEIMTVARTAKTEEIPMRCDLVGPICESGDYIAKDCKLPNLTEGDLLVILGAGAYGAVMSSTYNSRPLIPEVLVRGGDFSIIRRRQSVEEAMRLEEFSPWQTAGEPLERT